MACERRTIDAGATAVFSFTIGREQLGSWTTDAATPAFVVEPGLLRGFHPRDD